MFQRYNATFSQQIELRRVMTWPGLASAAKVGEIKLKELRQKAVNALGELFKLRDFHTVILKCAGPISLVQLCVDHYIASVTHEDAAASSTVDNDQGENNNAADDSLAPENVPPDHNSAHSYTAFLGHYYIYYYVLYHLSLLLATRKIL